MAKCDDSDKHFAVSRRSAFAALAALPAVAAGATRSPPDQRRDARALIKLHADLDPSKTSPWWYAFTIYAITAGKQPTVVLRGEGCEIYRSKKIDDGSYITRNATLSVFKGAAVDSGWIDHFDNPFTGKRNPVRTNGFSGVETLFARDGSPPMYMVPGARANGAPSVAGFVEWVDDGDDVICTRQFGVSQASSTPMMEVASVRCRRRDLLDPVLSSAPATFTSTYFGPWLSWMEMDELPGQMMWHSTGRKLRSLSELPAGYRARAEQLAPGKLVVPPFA